MRILLVAALSLCLSPLVSADEKFVCTQGDMQRVIEVVYMGEGPVPCEVRYDKGEGVEVLWSAENTEGFCESNAKSFVEQQEGWGWSCEHMMAETAAE